MTRYTIPVGENGRIILPRELRRMLGVDKGSQVVIEAQDERLELTTTGRLRREAQDRYRRLFPDRARGVVDEFLTDKREEARREGDWEPRPGSLADNETEGATAELSRRDASE